MAGCSVLVLLPFSLVCKDSPASGRQRRVFLKGQIPGLTVTSKNRLKVMVNVKGVEGFLSRVIVPLLWSFSIMVTRGVFTIQCDLGKTMILHKYILVRDLRFF